MTEENKTVIVATPPAPKPMWFWIKDSNGNASASLTFATIAFFVTTMSFIVSILQKVGKVEFRVFDSTACAAYMTPLLALYFSRRFTDSKYGSTNISQTDTPRE